MHDSISWKIYASRSILFAIHRGFPLCHMPLLLNVSFCFYDHLLLFEVRKD